MGKEFNSSYSQTSEKKVALNSVFEAFPYEACRRALEAINNRVIGSVPFGLQAGTAGTPGIAINSAIAYTIDGKIYTGTAGTNFSIPAALGTQGTASWCKYLVSVGTAGTYTITKGNEATSGSAGAFLPDLPLENCPVGYFVIRTGALHFTAGVGDPAAQTSVGYYNLVSMPIVEH